MPAGVMKGPDRPIVTAQHENRLVDNAIGKIIAAPGNAADMADTTPVVAEDVALFELEPVAIVIGERGQGRRRFGIVVEVEIAQIRVG